MRESDTARISATGLAGAGYLGNNPGAIVCFVSQFMERRFISAMALVEILHWSPHPPTKMLEIPILSPLPL
jgi:hypothetical protein